MSDQVELNLRGDDCRTLLPYIYGTAIYDRLKTSSMTFFIFCSRAPKAIIGIDNYLYKLKLMPFHPLTQRGSSYRFAFLE